MTGVGCIAVAVSATGPYVQLLYENKKTVANIVVSTEKLQRIFITVAQGSLNELNYDRLVSDQTNRPNCTVGNNLKKNMRFVFSDSYVLHQLDVSSFSGGTNNYHLRDCSLRYLGDGSPPVRFWGSPGRWKLKQFADIVYRFRLQKRSESENLHTVDPLFLTNLYKKLIRR